MRKLRFFLSLFFLLLVAAFVLACGSSRRLQSINVSPATASGQAQFVATGIYTDGSKVTPLPAQWFTVMPWYNELNSVQFFDLDNAGKAACNGNAGTFSVVAVAPMDPYFPLQHMTPSTPQVAGTARLSCP